jgi:hypothetical protein
MKKKTPCGCQAHWRDRDPSTRLHDSYWDSQWERHAELISAMNQSRFDMISAALHAMAAEPSADYSHEAISLTVMCIVLLELGWPWP